MVDKKTVEYVAQLARINLSEEEKSSLGKQLSKILDYIDKLKELDTDKVSPLRNLHESKDVLREDKVKPSEYCQSILENSPTQEDGYFKIPKVIE